MCKKVVCFDLDDTLYKEIDFLKSGYKKVAEHVEKIFGLDSIIVYDRLLLWYHQGKNPFMTLNETYGIGYPISEYLKIYRYHQPNISLSNDTVETLSALQRMGVILAIITDGREITQMQKIDALGLTEWICEENIIINENPNHFKPNHWSFDRLMLYCYEQYPDVDFSFCYVGDNPQKDFLAPNELKWKTICLLDDGKNIHKQELEQIDNYQSKYKVKEIREILNIV